MTYFLRQGNSFRVTNEVNLDIRQSLPVGNYVIKVNPMTEELYLEQVDSFKFSNKLYGDTTKHADRILNTYQDRGSSTGVLLNGEKGSGKTLLARMLSIKGAERGWPTIIINNAWTGDKFSQLIQSIDQPCIVLFDEFEKVYDREDQPAILTLLDGVFPTKKLFVLTCNDKYRIDDHMRNRPGRIFYMIDYVGLDGDFIAEYCDDNLKNLNHVEAIKRIAMMFNHFNFDMLKAMVEEMNRYDESPYDVMKMLNTRPDGEVGNFDVDLYVNNVRIIPDQYEPVRFSRNPIGQQQITIEYWPTPESDTEYFVVTPNDCKEINADAGTFTFINGIVKVVFRRKTIDSYDYRNLLV